MRPFPFILLIYLAVGLQMALADRLGQLNFVLIAVVFVVLNAPREPAMLGAFVAGLAQDLASSTPLGTYALSYGLFAALIVGSKRAVYGSHPLTHAMLAFVGGLVTAFVLIVVGYLRPETRVGAGVALLSALVTAIAAAPLLWPVEKMRRVFGFSSRRSAF